MCFAIFHRPNLQVACSVFVKWQRFTIYAKKVFKSKNDYRDCRNNDITSSIFLGDFFSTIVLYNLCKM